MRAHMVYSACTWDATRAILGICQNCTSPRVGPGDLSGARMHACMRHIPLYPPRCGLFGPPDPDRAGRIRGPTHHLTLNRRGCLHTATTKF